MIKRAPGYDGLMDYYIYPDNNKIEKVKQKILDTCVPYEIFRNKYHLDEKLNKLVKNGFNDKTSNKEYQKQAFYILHKKLFPNLTYDEIIENLANSFSSRICCEWCGKTTDELFINYSNSIYLFNNYIGYYKGCLCKSCNRIEGILHKVNNKKIYLKDNNFGYETIDYILSNWY